MEQIENKIEICDKCKKNFTWKWVEPQKRLSRIHEVSYWTEGKEWGNYKVVCRACLKNWFENERKSYTELVSTKRKRLFTQYYYSGLLDRI